MTTLTHSETSICGSGFPVPKRGEPTETKAKIFLWLHLRLNVPSVLRFVCPDVLYCSPSFYD
jgi:hypothetical protein